MLNGPGPSLTRFVDADARNDRNNGMSTTTAFQSLARALEEIPPVLVASYEIRLAADIYSGSAELVRSGSASDLSAEEIVRVPLETLPLIRIVGPT